MDPATFFSLANQLSCPLKTEARRYIKARVRRWLKTKEDRRRSLRPPSASGLPSGYDQGQISLNFRERCRPRRATGLEAKSGAPLYTKIVLRIQKKFFSDFFFRDYVVNECLRYDLLLRWVVDFVVTCWSEKISLLMIMQSSSTYIIELCWPVVLIVNRKTSV